MRIVNRSTFLAMPSGTVYAKYSPCIFGGLAIKYDSTNYGDWIDLPLSADQFDWNSSGDFSDKCDAMAERGASFPLTLEGTSRDGLFDADQMFIVLDRADVETLIAKLRDAAAPPAVQSPAEPR